MTREELTHIADMVLTNWNMDLGGDRRKAFYRTWWRYLGDLDMDATQTAVDALILADKPFAPRAGTVRRMVLAHLLTDVPTLEQAWAQAQTRIHETQQGMWSDNISPMVGAALAESGVRGTSRDDHEAFTRAWRRVVDALELERLGLPTGDR